MSGTRFQNSRRRGSSLLVVTVLLPIAMVTMMMLLENLQLRAFEMQRNEWRTQSRMLAESAVALATTLAEPPARPLDGVIPGAGEYRLESRKRPDGTPVLIAIGVCGPPTYRVTTEIELVNRPGGGLAILSTQTQAKPGNNQPSVP